MLVITDMHLFVEEIYLVEMLVKVKLYLIIYNHFLQKAQDTKE